METICSLSFFYWLPRIIPVTSLEIHDFDIKPQAWATRTGINLFLWVNKTRSCPNMFSVGILKFWKNRTIIYHLMGHLNLKSLVSLALTSNTIRLIHHCLHTGATGYSDWSRCFVLKLYTHRKPTVNTSNDSINGRVSWTKPSKIIQNHLYMMRRYFSNRMPICVHMYWVIIVQ